MTPEEKHSEPSPAPASSASAAAPAADPFAILGRDPESELAPEEEALLEAELSEAYHLDEAVAENPSVHRIAEKVGGRIEEETGRSEQNA
jgi:hypothetical protein